MKKLLAVCLMLFLNYSNSTAQNGNYHKLLEEDSKWRIGYMSCGWYVTDLQMSEYDTLINGQNYNRIEEYDSYSGNLSKTYYVREDVNNQKVYEYHENLQTEFLLYDFGVEVGQTFNLQMTKPWGNTIFDLPHIVNDIDEVQLENGDWRKRIHLTRLATTIETADGDVWDFPEDFHYTWIEGVGCDIMPVVSYFPRQWRSTLFCHQRRGQLLIENSQWESFCDEWQNTAPIETNGNSSDEVNVLETDIEDLVDVSPNPANIAWSIQIAEAIRTPSVLQLFDIKGQLLKSIAASNEKIQIENEQLPAGIYFLKIMQNGKTLGSLKLQKQ